MVKLNVKGKNAYKVAADFVFDFFGYYAPAIVDLETENCGRSNNFISPYNSSEGPYEWENDWYEGGDEVIIHGIIRLDFVEVPALES